MEEQNQSEETQQEEISSNKQWLQDNLRIIVSIAIVILIAGGIYSYSERTEAPVVDNQASTEVVENENGTITEGAEVTAKEENKNQAPEVKKVEGTSQETETAFVETAGKGEGATHLARRALANYLEKNQDSSLVAEQKIYIEDYLRKNSATGKQMHVGSSMEFSKDNIQKAIEKSKALNENQLKNLKKYSSRVSSLS